MPPSICCKAALYKKFKILWLKQALKDIWQNVFHISLEPIYNIDPFQGSPPSPLENRKFVVRYNCYVFDTLPWRVKLWRGFIQFSEATLLHSVNG